MYGTLIRTVKGDTRSSDYGSYEGLPPLCCMIMILSITRLTQFSLCDHHYCCRGCHDQYHCMFAPRPPPCMLLCFIQLHPQPYTLNPMNPKPMRYCFDEAYFYYHRNLLMGLALSFQSTCYFRVWHARIVDGIVASISTWPYEL